MDSALNSSVYSVIPSFGIGRFWRLAMSQDLQNQTIKDAKTIREDLVDFHKLLEHPKLKPPLVDPVIENVLYNISLYFQMAILFLGDYYD